MSLKIYNTLTNEKELFVPIHPGKVGIYLCGPTVYKESHIGHAVGPVIFDAFKRFLCYKGFKVMLIVNITDVDDKIIDQAAAENCNVRELAERITRQYLDCEWHDISADDRLELEPDGRLVVRPEQRGRLLLSRRRERERQGQGHRLDGDALGGGRRGR